MLKYRFVIRIFYTMSFFVKVDLLNFKNYALFFRHSNDHFCYFGCLKDIPLMCSKYNAQISIPRIQPYYLIVHPLFLRKPWGYEHDPLSSFLVIGIEKPITRLTGSFWMHNKFHLLISMTYVLPIKC